MIKYLSPFLVVVSMLVSCNPKSQQEHFDPESVKPIIQKLDDKWSEGVRNRDINVISSIYAEQSHYIPNYHTNSHGNSEITKYWINELKTLRETKLLMETLEGTRDILYETGKGYAYAINQKDTLKLDTFQFKYVNVWRLQSDGRYRCVIDTYNAPGN